MMRSGKAAPDYTVKRTAPDASGLRVAWVSAMTTLSWTERLNSFYHRFHLVRFM